MISAGYMSVSFHTKMARGGHLYKLTEEGLIVGGAILFLQGNVLNIGRVFVDSEHFRMVAEGILERKDGVYVAQGDGVSGPFCRFV
jgi:hypothetical protein